jgi:hypothetical protein
VTSGPISLKNASDWRPRLAMKGPFRRERHNAKANSGPGHGVPNAMTWKIERIVTAEDFVVLRVSGRIHGENGAAAKLRIPPSTLESRIKSLEIRKSQFKFGWGLARHLASPEIGPPINSHSAVR